MSTRSAALTWLRLRWPREVHVEELAAVFRSLAASGTGPIVLEAVGTATGVYHYLGVPGRRAGFIVGQLRAALPGLSAGAADASDRSVRVDRAIKLRLSTRRRPLRTDHPEQLVRSLLATLASVGDDERLVLQWTLGAGLAPLVIPSRLVADHSDSWVMALLRAPWQAPTALDAEARSALRAKQGEPGWRAIGRIAVRAATAARQRQLLGQMLSALRSAQGPGVRLQAGNERPERVERTTVPWRWPLTLNVQEVLALSSWPVGPAADLPIQAVGSRRLPASRVLATKGRVIGETTLPGAERPVALSPEDSLRHLHVLGPTGVGKSTLLLNLIEQDMRAGRGVVVIEPKGDLVAAALERVPERRERDVVLLDPTDEIQPVGINPLRASGRSPELVADQLLAVFHGLYAAYWGPRTQDILHACLLTLARIPGMTLAALPLLLTDATFRRRMVGRLNDPLALGPFWAAFEAWGEAERLAAIAPVMNKLRPFILRPQLRRLIGQANPRFDVRQVFTERKVLLVDLGKGRIGPEAAALLGSLVVAQLWQATLERSGIDPKRRHPVMVFIDEFQNYLHLPTDLSDALAEARGLGVGLTLAHQHLHQLLSEMRSAVLANARSRVCFQLGLEDARTLAAGGIVLQPEDFQGLGPFEAYASLVARGAVQPWCSLRTLAAGPATSDPATVRAASRERYGVPKAAVEAELANLLFDRRHAYADDLSPRKSGHGDGR